MHVPMEVLGMDDHMRYRARGHERVDIAGTRPVREYQATIIQFFQEIAQFRESEEGKCGRDDIESGSRCKSPA
jgi:hypothetical protein